MSIIHLIVASLAVWEIIEIWRHSSLFASWRARVELWEGGLHGWLHELLMCAFCLAPWVAFATCVSLHVPLLRLLVYAFAVARLANLGNDLTHSFCRTPKFNELDIPDDVSQNEDSG